MRVIYVVSLFPCWSETFIVREIRELLRQGVDIRIISLRNPSETLVQSDIRELQERVSYPPRFRRACWSFVAAVVRAPRRNLAFLVQVFAGLYRHPLSLAKTLVAWWRTLALLPEVRTLAPDVIHAHWATYPSTSALLFSRLLGIPFSFTSHAHDLFLEDHLLRRKLSESAFAVTISDFNRTFLCSRFGERLSARLHVIHCGIPLEDFEYRPDGRTPGVILAVGRLDEIKGFDVLVDACCILLGSKGAAFRCLIVGEGPMRRRLEEEATNAAGCIELLGALPLEEVRNLLYKASLFVLPSVVALNGNRDGIPVALMEAMAAGTPVISTSVSGIPELIRDGATGFLVAPADPEALANRILGLLSDPRASRETVEGARRAVEEHFNVRLEAEKLLSLFKAAVRGFDD